MKAKKAGAVSEAQKLREKLSNMNKQRTEFENKTKELETHMVVGFDNLEKIEKGIKSNDLKQAESLEVGGEIVQTSSSSSPAKSPSRQSSPMKRRLKASADGSTTPVKEAGIAPMLDGFRVVETFVMPPGLRVSDWCFLGAHDSTPPVVKANDIYENIRLLGRGSFGDVYLVKNREDNRMFANKTIFCEKEKYMEETLREVQFMRKNRHPCIIDIHDGFITSQPRILNIVMSYCEAGDLGKVVSAARKGKTNISETQIVKWSMQIALAIHFLHENGVIHRDLKPVNVMLTEGGDLVKVADFGLAMEVQSGKREGYHEAGTPYYTAPEMIQGLAYNYPVDCFAFGVMLHELMRLDLPFQGSSTGDLVRSILQDDPPALPSQYSEELKNITLLLMAKDPSKRMGFAGMLSHPLFNSKMLQFQTNYKPKSLDERIRRVFLKQLGVQIEGLAQSKKSSLESYTKLWDDHIEAVAVKLRFEEESRVSAALAAEEAIVAMTNKAMSRASSRKQVKPRSGSPGGGGESSSLSEHHHEEDDEHEHHEISSASAGGGNTRLRGTGDGIASAAISSSIELINSDINNDDADVDATDAMVTPFNDADLFELSASSHQFIDTLSIIPVTGGRGGDEEIEMDSWEATSNNHTDVVAATATSDDSTQGLLPSAGHVVSNSHSNNNITVNVLSKDGDVQSNINKHAYPQQEQEDVVSDAIASDTSNSHSTASSSPLSSSFSTALPIVSILSNSKKNTSSSSSNGSSDKNSHQPASSKRAMFTLPDIHSNNNSARRNDDDDENTNINHDNNNLDGQIIHQSEIPTLPKI